MRASRNTSCTMIILCVATVSHAKIITSQVGDVDQYRPGDPSDTPYRSSAVLDKMNQGSFALIEQQDLDSNEPGTVGFTHAFEPVGVSDVTSAVMWIHLRPVGNLPENDWLTFDNGDATFTSGKPIVHHLCQVIALPDIHGSWPLPWGGTLFKVDLMNAPYRTQDLVASTAFQGEPTGYTNLVPYLTDGELDVIAWDDVSVDYSILEITLVPEPASVFVLGLAGIALLWRRKR